MRHIITIETPSLGDRASLVHDGATAVVIDPPRDIDRVLEVADEAGVEIGLILETHLHNDYVSGGLALARRTGATYGHAAAEPVSFDRLPVRDGDRLLVGALTVEAVATPGHTPHHLAFVVHADGQPPAAFTGGSLLHGTVGRTDLIGDDATDELTRAQYRSAQLLAERLPDDAEIHPTHGFGSFCSSGESEADSDGTMGREREINIALNADSEDDFVRDLLAGLRDHPAYYAHMDPLNRAGGLPIDLSPPAPADAAEVGRRIHRGEWVVDLRDRRTFAGDHLLGTIGIEPADAFATYLGWLIPWGTPVTLLAGDAEVLERVQRQLVRIGIDRPAGAHDGAVEAWPADQRGSYPVVDFGDVAAARAEGPLRGAGDILLDVRRADEWSTSHIEGAHSLPIHELLDRLDELPDARLWVHCASGFRAAICASLLHRSGRDVVLVDDDFAKAADRGLDLVGG